MKLVLLETDAPGAIGFEFGFRDHGLQQAQGIAERLESVLPRSGGEIPG